MLKKRLLEKTIYTLFIFTIVVTILTIDNKNIIRTNLEIETVSYENNNYIYLLNDNNLLVKSPVSIKSKKIEEKVKEIISLLTKGNNNIPNGLYNYLPKEIKIKELSINDDTLNLNFNKTFNNISNDDIDIVVTGLVYSILEIDQIKNINILVEDNYLKGYEKPLDKSIGINNEYLFHNRKDIEKVVVYYTELINENTYYIPVTKYIDNNDSKMKVIIEELKNNSLDTISYIDKRLELIDYREEANVLFLNFNDYLLDDNKEVENTNLNVIAYSVFDNYDVNMVMFEINNKKLTNIKR
ncbi:MAG: GerMN domain-containing protein [Bacilli bacterium]|nr:GerMN domain-containing protein [Bacilli bacterium]